MTWKTLRRWIGPVLLFLIGLMGVRFTKAGLISNLVFTGNFHFDLAALFFYATLIASLLWSVGVFIHLLSNHRVKNALTRERLAQTQERQQFLRRLDHELKNPLTTIRLGITNLKENTVPGEEMTGSLERISQQAQRLQILVENLRRLGEMNENSLDRTLVSLPEILEEAIELACEIPECHGRKVSLTLQQVPWPLSSLWGDRDLLLAAFRNLIENSLKFSAPEGLVEVRASEDGHTTLVEVDDNGRGIQSEDLPHIFDELYRGENSRDLPGSGLGLALVRRIIELHGGTISVNSRPGQGTMMRVSLPSSNR